MKYIFSRGGAFPVRRGFRDEEAFTTADVILDQDGCIAMYCEGGRSRTGKIAKRAKRGIGRLALQSGAWVVPVGIYGSAKVRNWKRFQIPKISVRYGKPIRWDKVAEPTLHQQQVVADGILDEIKKIYALFEDGVEVEDGAQSEDGVEAAGEDSVDKS
jgi:1-acyl-sn-glycerol-3-phosphate acyltransferase